MNSFAKETLPISLEEEMRHSYLDYAMSVIVGRALPDVRDGLKPVHRRVLFAMHEANTVWNRPYVKCARVVGEVMGKFHPHGDSAIYDTLVRMAQDFSLRYTLVDGQGNFGSIDGDSAAAMRYTECRLEKMAADLLADIDKETVDFQPNYDGKELEPTVLPTRVPNLLINGSAGIAVGMATNIPPHNMSEVIEACLSMLANPDMDIEELIKLIPAPDFPTAGLIYGLNGVQDGYRTGRGRVVMRARTHFEDMEKGNRQAIIVDEIPYQVNKKSLVEKIAELVNEKKISGKDIATRMNSSTMCRNSAALLFKKFLRAGTLKKRFFIAMLVPTGAAIGSCFFTILFSISIKTPVSSSGLFVFNSTWATAAMLASASPLNPIVLIRNRSSILVILLVACRSKAILASVSLIPLPLSITCTRALPASLTINLISVAPASTAFSNNSFTALAGRCITSPAAIWLAMLSGNN